MRPPLYRGSAHRNRHPPPITRRSRGRRNSVGVGQNEGGVLAVGENELDRSAVPMRLGESVPPPCTPLSSCQTASNKMIQICEVQDEADVSNWTAIQYRFGPRRVLPSSRFQSSPRRAGRRCSFCTRSPEATIASPCASGMASYSYRVFPVPSRAPV